MVMFTLSAHVSRDHQKLKFSDKTVIVNFKIFLFSESLYFHLCNKNTESHVKNLILWILCKISFNVSLIEQILIPFYSRRMCAMLVWNGPWCWRNSTGENVSFYLIFKATWTEMQSMSITAVVLCAVCCLLVILPDPCSWKKLKRPIAVVLIIFNIIAGKEHVFVK